MKFASSFSIFVLFLSAFIIVSCSPKPLPPPEEEIITPGPAPGTDENENNTFLTPSELLRYKPNELGEAMILMYHNFGKTEGEWTRTPENFRRDLETLYNGGYRTVNLMDYVRGNIDLPAGKSPVILTFDDASQGQFNYLVADAEPVLDPDSALGILENFIEEYPDFGRAGTFYLYYPLPFRQKEYIAAKLSFLRSVGYEIGNHTYSHANLAKLEDILVMQELALHVQATERYLPGYQVLSLSLPYGAAPKNKAFLKEGEYEGFTYKNETVLLVGSRPAPSPFSTAFNPQRLPRIRASETKVDAVGLYDWLAYFESKPACRYVSDGNPNVLTAPAGWEDKLNPAVQKVKKTLFYNLDGE